MKKNFSIRQHVLAVISALSLIIFVVACNKDNNDNPDVPVSGLMAFNVSPDIAANIALSGNYLTPGPIVFSNYTGGYYAVYSGARSVQTYNAATGISVASSTYDFQPDQYYSLFVAGANDNYRNIIVHDNIDSLPSMAGEAYVRYINAIPDSSASTVTVTTNGSDVVNMSAGYGTVSDFTAVDAGDVAVKISNGTTIDAMRTINLEERKVYTVLLIGMPGATTGADSVQVRYVLNGTLDADAGMDSAVNSVNSN